MKMERTRSQRDRCGDSRFNNSDIKKNQVWATQSADSSFLQFLEQLDLMVPIEGWANVEIKAEIIKGTGVMHFSLPLASCLHRHASRKECREAKSYSFTELLFSCSSFITTSSC